MKILKHKSEYVYVLYEDLNEKYTTSGEFMFLLMKEVNFPKRPDKFYIYGRETATQKATIISHKRLTTETIDKYFDDAEIASYFLESNNFRIYGTSLDTKEYKDYGSFDSLTKPE